MRGYPLFILLGYAPMIGWAQPSNNDCANAITIPVNIGSCTPGGSYSTVGATNSLSNACMSFLYEDTWYKFTPTTTVATLEGTAFSSLKIELFETCGGSSLACSAKGATFTLTWPGLTPNHEYVFRIGVVSGEGTINLCLWEPLTSPYNDCPGAILAVGTTCNFTSIDNSSWTESYLSSSCNSLEFFIDGFIQVNIPQSGNFHLDFGNVPSGQDFEVYQGISCVGSSIYCGYTTGNTQHTVNAPTAGWHLIRTGNGNGDPTGDIQVCVWQSVLPIELLSLQAQPQKTNTHLTWRTASESQNAHFEVEHSRNGVSFESIGKMPGHGTTTEPNEYSFTHERPGPGTHYYRLRQVDFDGGHTYSQVVSIDQTGLRDLSGLALWPNPTTGIVNLGGELPEGTAYTVSDVLGRQLIKGNFSSAQLDLTALRPGIYWVSIVSDFTSNTFRIVKE